MSRQAPPHAQVPAVQRLRVRFAKRGRLRFVSHRDFQRAFERALRRAEVPIAYSQGYTPHPKISYAGAAPTGAASEAEYLEMALTQSCAPDAVRVGLDAALPPGLDVLEVVEAAPGSLADRLHASVWQVRLPGVPVDRAEDAVRALLAEPVVEVERLTKNGVRTLDARAAVLTVAVSPDPSSSGPCAILDVVVRHGTPTVRPDDVLAGLRRVADLVPPQPPRATRLAQGPLDEASGTVGDPLAPDRDTARTRGPAVATTVATDA
jgi:radical SAM-linked protein